MSTEVAPLPPRARLFHIGPYKTGTTAIQATAAAARPVLLANGVRYPGRQLNHRVAVNAFMGRGFGWETGDGPATAAPRSRPWREVRREIEAESERRIWFGHEYASSATDEQARALVEELGPRVQVVVTLRPFARVLPSLWQESLKRNAGRQRFESWLRDVLQPKRVGAGDREVRHDHAELVRRWVAAAGPDRVTVVALDHGRPDFLYRAFEGLLDLPDGLLEPSAATRAGNRSLRVAEAEMLRRLNVATRKAGLEWINHEWLVYHGAIGELLERGPAKDEARLRLPDWAFELAREQEWKIVAAIAESGAHVVGDLGTLVSAEPTRPYLDPAEVAEVPVGAAVSSMVGVIAAATGRDRSFDRRGFTVKRKLRAELAVNLPAVLRSLRSSR